MLLTRSQFLGLNKRRFKDVAIPDGIELPDGTLTDAMSVRIRSLTEGEAAAFEMSNLRFTKSGEKVLVSENGMQEHRRRLLRLVLVDDSNNTLLQLDDDAPLIELDGLVASTVYAEACKHCGMREADEAAEKNSKRTSDDAKRGS